jgi:hypothetical protein
MLRDIKKILARNQVQKSAPIVMRKAITSDKKTLQTFPKQCPLEKMWL